MLSKLIKYILGNSQSANNEIIISEIPKSEIPKSKISHSETSPLKIKYKSEKGYKLVKNKDSDACFDICTCEAVLLRKGTRTKLGTGLSVEIPKDYEIQVRSRSGLALKHGIFVLNSPGTVDSGYRGEIQIILQNSGSEDFRIEIGNKIAQLKIEKVEPVIFELVEEINLDTDRKDLGFGSSGV